MIVRLQSIQTKASNQYQCNNVTECRTSDMFSQNWKQVANLGHSYFLESVKISVSPD